MKTFYKYTLYILSGYALAVAVWGTLSWQTITLLQKIVVVCTVIVTLHEWEEQRFPGGFMNVMGGMMDLDVSALDLHAMQSKPDIFIFVLTILALVLSDVYPFACAVMILGLFEGFIHLMGIKLARMPKPYTPGMVTAELYAVCVIIGLVQLSKAGVGITVKDWLLGIVWYLAAFGCLEFSVWGAAGLSPKDVAGRMKANLARIRG